jgi:hypothetical protein
MAARKTSSAPTRVWKFAARVQDTRIVGDAHRYYNRRRERHRTGKEVTTASERLEDSDVPWSAVIPEAERDTQQRHRDASKIATLVTRDCNGIETP